MVFRFVQAVMDVILRVVSVARALLVGLWTQVVRRLGPVRAWLEAKVAMRTGAIVGLVALNLGCMGLFQLRKLFLGPNNPAPDTQIWYSAEDLTAFFTTAGPSGRMVYAATQVTLDLVFPIAYASLLVVLIHLLWREKALGFLWPLPLFAGMADIGENLLLSGQALAFHGEPSAALATVAAVFTLSKWLLVYASFLLLGGVFGLRARWWVYPLALLWVGGAGALVLHRPVALVPALLLAIIVHRRWLYLFQYLFFLRYALLGAVGLVLLPGIGTTGAGEALLKNLFVLPGPIQMLSVASLVGILAMTVMWTTRLVLRTAPARLALPLARSDVSDLRKALEICGPTEAGTSTETRDRQLEALAEMNFKFLDRVAPTLRTLAPWIFSLLAIPFLWAVGSESTGSWVTLTAMPLVVIGWAGLAQYLLTEGRRAYDKRIEESRQLPSEKAPLGKAGSRPRHGFMVGFGGQGHVPILVFMLVVGFVYVVLGAFLNPNGASFPDGFPAVGFALLVAVVAVWALSTLALFFDRSRTPVIVVTLGLLFAVSLAVHSDHYYRLVPRPDGMKTLPTPLQAFQAWSDQHDTGYVTVIAASGGGIKAALWTATAMKGLLTVPKGNTPTRARQDLASSIILLSTNSGGSVGGMYVTQAFAEGGPPDPAALETVVELAGESSLTASVWGMAYPDLWRFLSGGLLRLGPRTIDRGWAMDRRWERRRASLEAAVASGQGADERPHATLGDWAKGVQAGWRPAHIFNATVVESGAAFRMATVDLPRESGAGHPGSEPHELWDLYECAQADIEVATAARLSATFPWVSPMAREWADTALATGAEEGCSVNERGAFRLADGGYFDNFGVFSAIEFLKGIGTTSLTEAGIGRVLFVQIRATPEEGAQRKPGGLHYSLFGPVMAMNSVRTSSQIARNKMELDLLAGRWAHEGVKVVSVVLDLKSAGPLSWHLSETERDAVEKGWDEPQEKDLEDALEELFEEEPAEEPGAGANPPTEADTETER